MAATTHVLIVEDDIDQAKLFELALAMDGYHTICSLDAQTALLQLADLPCDLALVDWDLPGVKGDDFITQLREQFPAIKTVLISNHRDVDIAAKRCRADAWIIKSDGVIQMRQKVAELLATCV